MRHLVDGVMTPDAGRSSPKPGAAPDPGAPGHAAGKGAVDEHRVVAVAGEQLTLLATSSGLAAASPGSWALDPPDDQTGGDVVGLAGLVKAVNGASATSVMRVAMASSRPFEPPVTTVTLPPLSLHRCAFC